MSQIIYLTKDVTLGELKKEGFKVNDNRLRAAVHNEYPFGIEDEQGNDAIIYNIKPTEDDDVDAYQFSKLVYASYKLLQSLKNKLGIESYTEDGHKVC